MCPYGGRFVSGTHRKGHMVCHCLLIETPRGLILVDTGIGTLDIASPKKHLTSGFVWGLRPKLSLEETAQAQVAALGYSPNEVRHIVVTHLDVDHAGGIPDFPLATVHVYAQEHEAAMARRTMREQLRYRPHQYQNHTSWDLVEPHGETWFGFECVQIIPDTDAEILLVPLTGHTRGHCAVAVRTQNDWLLHAGDAYFHHHEVHGATYQCPPFLRFFQNQVAMDKRSMQNNRARLRELAASHDRSVRIFSAHDPTEFERLSEESRLFGEHGKKTPAD